MGIKHFFTWFRSNFPNRITNFSKLNVPNIDIDNFMIDLNGVFHTSAQRVFEYGNYAKQKSLLGNRRKVKLDYDKLYRACYKDICDTIDELVLISKPKKRLVLAIDGVAPLGKQNQQRQRRYRSVMENPTSEGFDPNCITPGTKFMHDLSIYIDMHIRKNVNAGTWDFQVIFSNEKCPGEGEHKLINYIRRYGKDDESFCINALDADLFMLSLGTNKSKFYLLRENLYDPQYDYMFVNIGDVSVDLKKLLSWEGCEQDRLVNDFILSCFLCGNDFLPNMPSISIMENGLDMIIEYYKKNAKHIVNDDAINFEALKGFLTLISNSESDMMMQKIKHRNDYIEDTLLKPENFVMSEYQKAYNERYFNCDIQSVSHEYLHGCQWVLTYYLKGVTNWEWMYRQNYSPFASDLINHIDTFKYEDKNTTGPLLPIQQLLCVLPPKSFNFIPKPLDKFYVKYPELYPEKFNINYEGKKKKWEGVVELPCMDVSIIKSISLDCVKPEDKIRNSVEVPKVYGIDEFSSDFKCQFGSIRHCSVFADNIEF